MTTTLELPSVELYRLLGSVAPLVAKEDPAGSGYLTRVRLSVNTSQEAPVLRTMAANRYVLGVYRHVLTTDDHAHDDNTPVHDVLIESDDVAAMLKLLKSAGGRKFSGTARLTLIEDGTGELSTMGFGDHVFVTAPPVPGRDFASVLARAFTPTTERREQTTAAVTVDTELFGLVLKAAAAVNVTTTARDVGHPLTWWPGEKPTSATGFMVGPRLAGVIMPWRLLEGDYRRAAWAAYSTEPGWPA